MTLLALLPWLALVAVPLLLRGRTRIADFAPAEQATPLVSIIVPARDEAHHIGACVASLLDCDYAEREIIVVDDGSGDGTGDIALVLAAHSDGAVRVVTGKPLPPDWRGKAWACWQGYEAARGELLLFTDADTRHDAPLLGRAVGAMQSSGAGMVTLVPRFIAASFWEAAVLPHLWLASMLRARVLGRGERAPLSANGQYMLVQRGVYEKVGGHEAVRGALAEDVELAARVARASSPPLMVLAEGELEARPTTTVRGMVAEWTRRLGGEHPPSGMRRRLLLGSLAVLVAVLWIVPPVTLVASLLGSTAPGVLGWAAAASALSVVFWILVHGRLGIRRTPAFVYPVGAFAFGFVLLRLASRAPRLRWKGREYTAEE